MGLSPKDLFQVPFDWEAITPEGLENLVYGLLDDMGFKNIRWLKGGEGISSTDGGRDLEAIHANLAPGDEYLLEKWWVEVKYRSKTLPIETIERTVLNSFGRPDVDVLLIVTNNVITNKTVAWLDDFRLTHPRPRITIWQRHDLERHLRRYPGSALRAFPSSLSLPGKLAVVESRFWNALLLPAEEEITAFWKGIASLGWTEWNVLPILCADGIDGNVEHRHWGLLLDVELLKRTLSVGLANTTPWALRAEQRGYGTHSLMAGLEYLLQMALLRCEMDDVLQVVRTPYEFVGSPIDSTPELMDILLHPLLANLFGDLLRSCHSDCPKYEAKGNEFASAAVSYFSRFARDRSPSDPSEPLVLISSKGAKCALGIVSPDMWCPLSIDIPEKCASEAPLRETLGIAQQVIRGRAARVMDSH
jgi:hypothetical protein